MKSRLISFAGSTITIEYGEGRPANIVSFLFDDVSSEKSRDSHETLRLEDDDIEQQLYLWQETNLVHENQSETGMAEFLMGQVCYLLAYESRQGLVLHAAGIRQLDQGIILPGQSGAGKSTLTAWLATHGADYLTDELTFIPEGTNEFRGLARPISLKGQARNLLQEFIGKGRQGSDILRGQTSDLLAPKALNARHVHGFSSLDLIIFPRFQIGSELNLRPFTTAKASFEMMKCLANARNLPEHGLQEAIRLAKEIPAYRLIYSDLNQAGRSIKSLLEPVTDHDL
jgi:hypothetical protein